MLLQATNGRLDLIKILHDGGANVDAITNYVTPLAAAGTPKL